MDSEKQVLNINVSEILPNRFQPRVNFNDDDLKELSESIKIHGIIQPLVLRKLGDKYEIIAGERRYRAAQLAGLNEVPAIIRAYDDNTSAEVALIENIQRKDLTAIEEAKSYRNLLNMGYSNQEELAKKLGVSQSTIANKIRLLNLCEQAQESLLNGQISERHARSLLTLTNSLKQEEFLQKIIQERLTVKQLDELIKEENNKLKPKGSDIETFDLELFNEPTFSFDQNKIVDLDQYNNSKMIENNNILEQNEILSTQEQKTALTQEESQNLFIDSNEPQKLELKVQKDDFETIIDSFKTLNEEISQKGYRIEVEDFNLDRYYQLIIKIYKKN